MNKFQEGKRMNDLSNIREVIVDFLDKSSEENRGIRRVGM